MLSAFIITCNRSEVLAACLKAARFADELIVVDKGRTLGARVANQTIARQYADRYERVPWSPTVEPTRQAALELCRGEWILSLDDDEILSPACAEAFATAIASDHADVFTVPMKHHILGRHDPRCSYWPEYRPCLFRRGFVHFGIQVHRGVTVAADAREGSFDLDGDVYIDHLSHENVSAWIEKTNRYTDQDDRVGVRPSGSLAEFAVNAMEARCAAIPDVSGRRYFEAIAILRAVYDIVDGLKRWEETEPDGAATFRHFCAQVLAR